MAVDAAENKSSDVFIPHKDEEEHCLAMVVWYPSFQEDVVEQRSPG